jgi:AcrR family transcriptional regulator
MTCVTPSGRGRVSTDQERSRSDAARTRLLDAATAAFADHGFHGTTTRDIASAAGMSPAAVYVHHRSKEELLYLISRAGHEHTLALVRRSVAATDGGPAEQLAAVMRDFAADHARTHTTARIVNYERAALEPAHHAEILELRRAIGLEFRELVRRGIESGEFHVTDADMAAGALMSLGIDVARWYRDGGSWSPEDIGAFYADLALRVVGKTS